MFRLSIFSWQRVHLTSLPQSVRSHVQMIGWLVLCTFYNFHTHFRNSTFAAAPATAGCKSETSERASACLLLTKKHESERHAELLLVYLALIKFSPIKTGSFCLHNFWQSQFRSGIYKSFFLLFTWHRRWHARHCTGMDPIGKSRGVCHFFYPSSGVKFEICVSQPSQGTMP